jgi:hypothetical protein
MATNRIKGLEGKKTKHANPLHTDTTFSFEHPIFCFKHLHKDYHIDKCTDNEKKQLIDKIIKISSITWKELEYASRKGLGAEKIQITSIKPSIPASFTDDVNHLLAFRFDGKKPFVGFRNKFVFHVFYIDRSFTLYNHE